MSIANITNNNDLLAIYEVDQNIVDGVIARGMLYVGTTRGIRIVNYMSSDTGAVAPYTFTSVYSDALNLDNVDTEFYSRADFKENEIITFVTTTVLDDFQVIY